MVERIVTESDAELFLGAVRKECSQTSFSEQFGGPVAHVVAALMYGAPLMLFTSIGLGKLGVIDLPIRHEAGWPIFAASALISYALIRHVEQWIRSRRRFALHEQGLRHNNRAFTFDEIESLLLHGTAPALMRTLPTLSRWMFQIYWRQGIAFQQRMISSFSIITTDGRPWHLDQMTRLFEPLELAEIVRMLNESHPGLVKD